MVSYELYSDNNHHMKYFIRFYSFLSIIWIGCSEPFEVDRHDLVSPRVLGVRLSDSGHFVQVWNGEGPWHDESPTIDWYDDDGTKLGESVHGAQVTQKRLCNNRKQRCCSAGLGI